MPRQFQVNGIFKFMLSLAVPKLISQTFIRRHECERGKTFRHTHILLKTFGSSCGTIIIQICSWLDYFLCVCVMGQTFSSQIVEYWIEKWWEQEERIVCVCVCLRRIEILNGLPLKKQRTMLIVEKIKSNFLSLTGSFSFN